MNKVLFVCLGNICRSPLAEIIFTDLILKMNRKDEFYTDSAGTGGWHTGEMAHRLSIEIAKRHGHNLNSHRARQVEQHDFELFDWIIAMDTSNFRDLKSYKKNPEKVLLMRDFDDLKDSLDVPDPYYQKDDGFESVYQILSRSINKFYQEFYKQKN